MQCVIYLRQPLHHLFLVKSYFSFGSERKVAETEKSAKLPIVGENHPPDDL